MSGTVSRGREAGQQAEALAAAEARGSRGRGRWVALGIVVVLAAGAVSAGRAGVFPPAAASGAGQQGAPAPATQPVTPQDIAEKPWLKASSLVVSASSAVVPNVARVRGEVQVNDSITKM